MNEEQTLLIMAAILLGAEIGAEHGDHHRSLNALALKAREGKATPIPVADALTVARSLAHTNRKNE